MRILVLTSLYPPHYRGGYEVNCETHADELSRRGHEVFVLTSRWGVREGTIEDRTFRLLDYLPERMGQKATRNRLDPLRIARRVGQLRWALAYRRNYGRARRLVRELGPDIAYVWQMGAVSVSPVLAAQDEGVPTVFNLGDYWLAELRAQVAGDLNWLRRWYRTVVADFGCVARLDLSHLLANSRTLVKGYVSAGIPEESFTVIPRGIPPDSIVSSLDGARRANGDEARLVFAGRLVPAKGADVAIEALAHLRAELGGRKLTLDIVGAGQDQYVEHLRQLVRKRGLEGHVRFLGQVERRQLLEGYSDYDVLLFPPRWAEPFGNVLVEAMARGLAVVATSAGGNPEIVSDGENGLLVPPDDAGALARAVERILADPGLAWRLRSRGLQLVRERYSQEKVMDQTENYLEAVAGGGQHIAT